MTRYYVPVFGLEDTSWYAIDVAELYLLVEALDRLMAQESK